MPCNSCARPRTPKDYVERAKTLSAMGAPNAKKAWLKAAVAYEIAKAQRAGDARRVRLGVQAMQGLRGLSSGGAGSRPPAPPLTAEQKSRLQAKIQQVAEARRTAESGVIDTVSNVASAVLGVVSLIVNAALPASDPGRADFNRVWTWITAVVSRGRIFPSGMSDADVNAMAVLCGTIWPWLGPLIQAGANTAMISTDDGVRAIGQIGRFAVATVNGWCSDPTIRALLTPTIEEVEEEYVPTELDWVRNSWGSVVTSRGLVEAILENAVRNPPTTELARRVVANARVQNCVTSERMRQISDDLRRLGGTASWRIPSGAWAGTYTAPTSQYYLRIPPTNCGGSVYTGPSAPSGGGGGAGVAIAAAVAIPALFFLMR